LYTEGECRSFSSDTLLPRDPLYRSRLSGYVLLLFFSTTLLPYGTLPRVSETSYYRLQVLSVWQLVQYRRLQVLISEHEAVKHERLQASISRQQVLQHRRLQASVSKQQAVKHRRLQASMSKQQVLQHRRLQALICRQQVLQHRRPQASIGSRFMKTDQGRPRYSAQVEQVVLSGT
jgi:hypothetical protein